MQHVTFLGLIFLFTTLMSPMDANVVRIIKDPSECAEVNNNECNCPCHRNPRGYCCNRCNCNLYQRSCVDTEDIEPVPSWPAYWDQPLQEELSR